MFMKLVKKYWFLVLVVVSVLGLFGYKLLTPAPLKGKAYIVKKGDLKSSLSFSGKVDAGEKVVLKFQSSGRLTWVGVKEGDYVKKFQGIASLDREQLKKTMEKYLNTYVKQRNSFEGSSADNKNYETSGTLSNAQKEAVKRTLSDAQASLNNSILDYEIQNLAYKDAYLYTPIEGLITRVAISEVGTNITPAGAEFEVVNPKTVFFSALADQTEIIKLRAGMKADLSLDAYPDEKITGEIISAAFSPKEGESGTVYEVKIAMSDDNSDMKYRLGMTGDVEFIFDQKSNVLSVPAKYVKGNGKREVYKLVNGKKEKVEIKIGETMDGSVIVLDGLKEGDVVYDQAN